MPPPVPASRRRTMLGGLASATLLLAAAPASARIPVAARARTVPIPVPAPPGRAAAEPATTATAARPDPTPGERALALRHLHTGEAARLVYRDGDRYLPEALRAADRLLRDWRAGETLPTDPALLDLLWDLGRRLGTGDAPVEIFCGYRTPETNALLRRRGGRRGGVARGSLHTRGMAVDLRIPGRPLPAVRAAGLALGRGGVGYYPGPGFVHLDTGPPRRW